MNTDKHGFKAFQANCGVIKQAKNGFEIKDILKVRPHPNLLPLEKEQREGICWFTK
jgi:hypothetical protein